VTLLLVVVGIAVVAAVALLVTRDRPVLDDDPVDPRRLVWPPEDGVGPRALADARFTVVLRGYRMDEVDRVLDDARAALVERDARIGELQRTLETLRPPTGPAVPPDQPGAEPPEGGLAGRSSDRHASAAPVGPAGER